jgi:fatty acid desaturase
VALSAGLIALFALFLAWFKHGRTMLPLSTLLIAPVYVLWKLPIYMKMLLAREKKWQRTQREG